MATDTTVAVRIPPAKEARLRATVLGLGGRLGWPPQEVAAFAEALTERPWQSLGQAELETVRDEYLRLLEVVTAKAARRAARHGGGSHASGH